MPPLPIQSRPAALPIGALLIAALGVCALALAGCQSDAQGFRTADAPAPRYTVVRVVDGDTVVLLAPTGEEEKVRIRGIDTPESHASSKLDRDDERSVLDRETIRALGKEATRHAERLLVLGTEVAAESDGRDRYGRLVAYLQVQDAGTTQSFDFGGRMIADGYAHAYDGNGRYPHPQHGYYRSLERAARAEGAGLWQTGLAELSP